MSLVKIVDLYKTYKVDSIETKALRGVNLTVEKGEFLVIAGASGSGKTTLLNIIGALDKPTQGEIYIDGENFQYLNKSRLAEFRLRNVGFIFQAYNLVNVLTALENVEYVMLLQGLSSKERTRRAKEMLELVGLKDYINRRPLKMSGGQQQRVAVARAIVSKPKLILADEPTANLDSETEAGLLDLLQELNEKHGVTFIIAAHDEDVIARAKRIVKLYDGGIISDEKIQQQ